MTKYSERKKMVKAIMTGEEYVPSPAKRQGLRARRKARVNEIRRNMKPAGPSNTEIPAPVKVLAVLFAIIVTWFYTGILRELIGHLSTHIRPLAQSMSDQSIAGLATLAVAVTGYGFFELRKRRRITYAIIEFIVALLVTTETFLRTSEPGPLAAAIATSIYFVVRAFDNFEKGLEPYLTEGESDEPNQRKETLDTENTANI